MPRAASSVGVGRRVKRETALVSYNDLKVRHSGDEVILLVGLPSYEAHLSLTFLSEKQGTPKLLSKSLRLALIRLSEVNFPQNVTLRMYVCCIQP